MEPLKPHASDPAVRRHGGRSFDPESYHTVTHFSPWLRPLSYEAMIIQQSVRSTPYLLGTTIIDSHSHSLSTRQGTAHSRLGDTPHPLRLEYFAHAKKYYTSDIQLGILCDQKPFHCFPSVLCLFIIFLPFLKGQYNCSFLSASDFLDQRRTIQILIVGGYLCQVH